MLQKIHPDVAVVKWKYNRWHHEVDYRPFKANELKFVDDYDASKNSDETQRFCMERVKI